MSRVLLTGCLVLGALSGAAPLVGETVEYKRDGKILFTIDYPEGWNVDTDFVAEAKAAGTWGDGGPQIEIVEAMPADGMRAWIGVWIAPPDVTNLEEAAEYGRSLGEFLMADVEAGEVEKGSLNGLDSISVEGVARRDGNEVEFGMAFFQATRNAVGAVLYIGETGAWEEHEDELESIAASVSPAE